MAYSILKIISKNIREQRLKSGWSQETLAKKCGLHRTYIGSIERSERNISIINLSRIADALNIDITELFI